MDLNSWINDPPSESSDSEDLDMNDIFIKAEKPNDSYSKREFSEPSLEELERRREARKLEQENNPHYLKGSFKTFTSYHNSSSVYEDFENIPIAELDIPISLKISNNLHRCRNIDSSHKRHKKHEKKKKSKHNKSNCFIHNIILLNVLYIGNFNFLLNYFQIKNLHQKKMNWMIVYHYK